MAKPGTDWYLGWPVRHWLRLQAMTGGRRSAKGGHGSRRSLSQHYLAKFDKIGLEVRDPEFVKFLARWRRGNAGVCKTFIQGFDSPPCLSSQHDSNPSSRWNRDFTDESVAPL